MQSLVLSDTIIGKRLPVSDPLVSRFFQKTKCVEANFSEEEF